MSAKPSSFWYKISTDVDINGKLNFVLKLYQTHFYSHEFYVLLASKDRLYAVFISICSSLFLAVDKTMCKKRKMLLV